ncbi:MAG: hypothetical protein ABI462_13515 [Ignavibacteria bacterium]
MSQFNAIGHFDHPGTSLQVIGAAAVKINYYLYGKNPNVYEDVFENPEAYLNMIFLFLLIINSLVLFVSGFLILRWFDNPFLSILIQLIPFVSFTVDYEFSTVSSENFLISIILLLIVIFIKYSRDDSTVNQKKILILFSLFSGLGLVTKITFMPILVIPLILLKGIRYKLFYIVLTLFSFAVFFSPAISNLNVFAVWIKNLFLNDGLYGGGQPDIVDPGSFLINLKTIFTEELFFTFSYCAALFVFILVFLKKQKQRSFSNELRLLLAFFSAMTLQVIIVSKHYSPHYMVPGLMFCIPVLLLCINAVPEILRFEIKGYVNYFYTALIFSVVIVSVLQYSKGMKEIKVQEQEASKINSFINENYNDAIVISSYGSSSKNYALMFSTTWAANQRSNYINIIDRLYPQKLYFEFWHNKIFTSSKTNIVDILHSGKKILFQNRYPESNDLLQKELSTLYGFKNAGLKEIFKNQNGESLYEVTGEQ